MPAGECATSWLSPWLKLRESSFELVKFESSSVLKTELQVFVLRLTSLNQTKLSRTFTWFLGKFAVFVLFDQLCSCRDIGGRGSGKRIG